MRIILINVHAGTRSRIASGRIAVGDTDTSNYACAQVLGSLDPALAEGDIIACQAGWQDYQVISSSAGPFGYGPPSELVKALNGTSCQWTYTFRPAMVKMWPADVLMDVFGTSGMTAYFGLRECGPLMPSDAVAVAATTGSVGSIAAQLARIAGCRVVGFAGGQDRCDWAVKTLGLHRCLDYRAADLDDQFRDTFPDGIDVYSDGVGGALTETVLQHVNRNGRLFSYGTSASFHSQPTSGPRPAGSLRQVRGITPNVEQLLADRNIKSAVWIVDEFYHERLAAEDDLSRLLRSGALQPVNTVIDGFDSVPTAVAGLYSAPRVGKVQVRFAANPGDRPAS